MLAVAPRSWPAIRTQNFHVFPFRRVSAYLDEKILTPFTLHVIVNMPGFADRALSGYNTNGLNYCESVRWTRLALEFSHAAAKYSDEPQNVIAANGTRSSAYRFAFLWLGSVSQVP